jgi:predicted nucleic acid-binding protein
LENSRIKYIFDTSVLIAAVLESHPKHSDCFTWLKKVKNGQINAAISSHTLMEIYAVLTALPVIPKISPGLSLRIIRQNIINNFKIITYSYKDYESVLIKLSSQGVTGGSSYDGLIFYAFKKSGADWLLTLNRKDFIKINPGKEGNIIEPGISTKYY